jgi:hypothetical protein
MRRSLQRSIETLLDKKGGLTFYLYIPGQLSEVLASPALGRSHSRSGYLHCIASVLININTIRDVQSLRLYVAPLRGYEDVIYIYCSAARKVPTYERLKYCDGACVWIEPDRITSI